MYVLKIIFSLILSSIFLFSYTLQVNKEWKLLGALNDFDIAKSISGDCTFYRYDNQWLIYSAKGEKSLTKLKKANGFYIYSPSTCTLNYGDNNTFTLSSKAIQNNKLLTQYTCEKKDKGIEKSIPLSWFNIPKNTKSLAISMFHYPKGQTDKPNSYLALWGINPNISSIAHGQGNNGSWYMGANKDGNNISYTSPCSKGGGTNEYTIKIYALSSTPPSLPKQSSLSVNFGVLQSALKEVDILGTASITFDASSNNSEQNNPNTPNNNQAPTTQTQTNNGTTSTIEAKKVIEDFSVLSNIQGLKAFDGNDGYVHIQSTGFANHIMMKGITRWNNQVPLPRDYSGDKVWKIRLNRNHNTTYDKTSIIQKGSIAIAVNGVPIFDPSDGSGLLDDAHDTYLIGETGVCGGHSGRGDDYHYHGPATCLMAMLKDDQPIGYAFDGYPIYGKNEIDGSTLDSSSLDEINGHSHGKEAYHYHIQDKRPYYNGGFRGGYDTNAQGAQPRPIRNDFEQYVFLNKNDKYIISDWYLDSDGYYNQEYKLTSSTKSAKIRYKINNNGTYDFEYYDHDNKLVHSKTY